MAAWAAAVDASARGGTAAANAAAVSTAAAAGTDAGGVPHRGRPVSPSLAAALRPGGGPLPALVPWQPNRGDVAAAAVTTAATSTTTPTDVVSGHSCWRRG